MLRLIQSRKREPVQPATRPAGVTRVSVKKLKLPKRARILPQHPKSSELLDRSRRFSPAAGHLQSTTSRRPFLSCGSQAQQTLGNKLRPKKKATHTKPSRNVETQHRNNEGLVATTRFSVHILSDIARHFYPSICRVAAACSRPTVACSNPDRLGTAGGTQTSPSPSPRALFVYFR